jgi:protein CpxP
MLALRGLDLTDAQREQVRQLTQQFREQNRPLAERMRQAMQARREAAQANPVDESRIRAASEELAQVQADLAVQEARLRNDVLALLTPEQRQKAEELRAQRDARLKERQGQLQQRRDQLRQRRQQVL